MLARVELLSRLPSIVFTCCQPMRQLNQIYVNINTPHIPLEHVLMLLGVHAASYKSNRIFLSALIEADKHMADLDDSGRRYLRCRRGSHCWLSMRGHRLWTQNAPRRNSSLHTSASAAYTHPLQSSSRHRAEK